MKKIIMSILVCLSFITQASVYFPVEADYLGTHTDVNFKREERLKNNEENYKKHKEFMDKIIGYWRNNGQAIIIGKDKDGYYMYNIRHVCDNQFDMTSVEKEYKKLGDYKGGIEIINKLDKNSEKYKKIDWLRDAHKYGYLMFIQRVPNRLWFDGKKFSYYKMYDIKKKGELSKTIEFWLTLNEKGELTYLPMKWKGITLEEWYNLDKNYRYWENTSINEIDKNEEDGAYVTYKDGKFVTIALRNFYGTNEERDRIAKNAKMKKLDKPNYTGEIFVPYTKEEYRNMRIYSIKEKLKKEYDLLELDKDRVTVSYSKEKLMYEPMRKMTEDEINIWNSYEEYKKPSEKESLDFSKRIKVTTNYGFYDTGEFEILKSREQIELDSIRSKALNIDIEKNTIELRNKICEINKVEKLD